MTRDKDYSDMGLCPECLSQGFDGVSDRCGYIERTERYDDREDREDDYNYLKHAEGD